MWYECKEPGCPAAGNSPKAADKHVADTGHEVDREED